MQSLSHNKHRKSPTTPNSPVFLEWGRVLSQHELGRLLPERVQTEDREVLVVDLPRGDVVGDLALHVGHHGEDEGLRLVGSDLRNIVESYTVMNYLGGCLYACKLILKMLNWDRIQVDAYVSRLLLRKTPRELWTSSIKFKWNVNYKYHAKQLES